MKCKYVEIHNIKQKTQERRRFQGSQEYPAKKLIKEGATGRKQDRKEPI